MSALKGLPVTPLLTVLHISQVESLKDFFMDVDNITAGLEFATTAEELETAIAAI